MILFTFQIHIPWTNQGEFPAKSWWSVYAEHKTTAQHDTEDTVEFCDRCLILDVSCQYKITSFPSEIRHITLKSVADAFMLRLNL